MASGVSGAVLAVEGGSSKYVCNNFIEFSICSKVSGSGQLRRGSPVPKFPSVFVSLARLDFVRRTRRVRVRASVREQLRYVLCTNFRPAVFGAVTRAG